MARKEQRANRRQQQRRDTRHAQRAQPRSLCAYAAVSDQGTEQSRIGKCTKLGCLVPVELSRRLLCAPKLGPTAAAAVPCRQPPF